MITGLCIAQLVLASALPVAGPCLVQDLPGWPYKNRYRIEIQARLDIPPGEYAVRVTSLSAAPAHMRFDIAGQASIILAPSQPLRETVNELTFNDGHEERWQNVTATYDGHKTRILFTEFQ